MTTTATAPASSTPQTISDALTTRVRAGRLGEAMAATPRKKPALMPAAADEARRTNVLLESIQREMTLMAEGVVDVRARVRRMEDEVASLPPLRDEVKSIGDGLRSLVKDIEFFKYSAARTPQELEAVKTELRLIRSDLHAFEKRLTPLETRLAP